MAGMASSGQTVNSRRRRAVIIFTLVHPNFPTEVACLIILELTSITTIGLFCPFAHRANMVRHLKGLTDIIDVSIVCPYPKGDSKGWPGWRFPKTNEEYPNATVDKLFSSDYLHDVYFRADKDYKGRYSVPLLWDTKTNTAVNNVSETNRKFSCRGVEALTF